ncbi:MAG: ATP-dependent DNA ligase, partial [Candidatus Ranarchaeia archaeon]
MTFSYQTLCEAYRSIEDTTKRLEMTDLLVNLFKTTSPTDIKLVIYLTQGKLHPDWQEMPELGLAEKMAIKALARASGESEEVITSRVKHLGDLGLAGEEVLTKRTQSTLDSKHLQVDDVYNDLDRIAQLSGKGTQGSRIRYLSGLLSNASPLEARYILRTVTGTLRLGIADMTILDALAIAFTGKKENREELERAYNVGSDLGSLARYLARDGLKALKQFSITHGRPIRMMLAQRSSTPEEIIERFGGYVVCEFKLDGERLQVHKNGDDIQLFSRHLEKITQMYPDVVESVRRSVTAKVAIFEGECVAYDKSTKKLQSFQILMQRRRKYRIAEMVKKIPTILFVFDILYLDGKDLTSLPYVQRRRQLHKITNEEEYLRKTPYLETQSPKQMDIFFHEALANGAEGLIMKRPDSPYEWGSRSWYWIKLKESYRSKMIEPVDLVIVGAWYGRGRRAGKLGALLLACYDPQTDTFPSITKVGTGFSDEALEEMTLRLTKLKRVKRHPRVDSTLVPDLWIDPQEVLEILGDEISISPIHRT